MAAEERAGGHGPVGVNQQLGERGSTGGGPPALHGTLGERWEARLAGAGGQGLITAGIILAEAAVLAGRNAVQTQSYGPESRGGASRAEVVISDGEIDFPKVTRPDVLLVMTAEACRRYLGGLRPGGLLVADQDLVEEIPSGPYRTVRVPITRIAREEVGREIVANIVALGVLVALTEVVPEGVLEEAVMARVPRSTEELNRRALHAGVAAGRAAGAAGGSGACGSGGRVSAPE